MLQANSISFFAFSSERYLLGSWTLKNFKAPSKSVNSKSSLEVLKKERKHNHVQDKFFAMKMHKKHFKTPAPLQSPEDTSQPMPEPLSEPGLLPGGCLERDQDQDTSSAGQGMSLNLQINVYL